MIRASGLPSTQSVTSTWPVWWTTEGTRTSGSSGVRRRERRLALCLEGVVELLGDPGLQLGDQWLDVEAGHEHADEAAHPTDLVEVGKQRLSGAGILHLDGHSPPVRPDRPVDLTDRRSRGGLVLEGLESVAPVGAELAGEHGVHAAGRQRRRGLLQPGEGLAVRAGEVLRQRRLEDRHGLAELHGPALELTEHPEQLLSGAGLDLGRDDLRGSAADPLAQAERRAPGEAQREPRELDRAGHGASRELGHIAHCH